MKTHRELFNEAITKVLVAVLAAATLFFVAFSWAAATGENLVQDVESGFSVKGLALALAAAVVFVLLSFVIGRTKSTDGQSKRRAAELALEYLDDFAGLLGSSGGVALLMFFNGRGATYGLWGVVLLVVAVVAKYFCSLNLQRISP